ncbi:MAG: ABC transporter permease [Pseudomonadota bacterium]
MPWYDIFEDFHDAWRDVCSRPFRSCLSAIGISVGVLALVAMISITSGAREQALAGAESLGLNTIRIESIVGELPQESLTVGDATRVMNLSGKSLQATYFYRQVGKRVQGPNDNLNVDVMAVPSSFYAVEQLEVARGALPADDLHPDACVAGASMAIILALEVGDLLVVNDNPCRVAAIAAPRDRLITEGTGLSAIDFNASIFVPFSSIAGRSQQAGVTGVIVRVAKDNQVTEKTALVRQALSQGHGKDANFLIVIPRQLASQVSETQQLFTFIMSALAGLALIVGGIGVANSLLATVAEQTREIGLRMAVGATANRVLRLYLFHALWISSFGALFGAIVGLAVASAIQVFAGWHVYLSVTSVLVGITFALVTGGLSATYPALRAANMSAARALIEH